MQKCAKPGAHGDRLVSREKGRRKKIGIIVLFVGNFNLAEALLCQKAKKELEMYIVGLRHPVREQAHNPNALQEAFSEKLLCYLYISVHKPRWTEGRK